MSSDSLKNDSFLDSTLRPKNWNEYIGQEKIKQNLKILLQAAEERNHVPEHILFHGPPGLGNNTRPPYCPRIRKTNASHVWTRD